MTRYKDENIIKQMDAKLREDISKAYADVPLCDGDDLMDYLNRVADTAALGLASTHVQGRPDNAGVCRCLYDRYPAYQEI